MRERDSRRRRCEHDMPVNDLSRLVRVKSQNDRCAGFTAHQRLDFVGMHTGNPTAVNSNKNVAYNTRPLTLWPDNNTTGLKSRT